MKSRITPKNIFTIDDSRQVLITAGEMKRQFQAEFNAKANEIFDAAKRDITAQLMATCMVELQTEFGFGKNRLQKFKRGVEGLFLAMIHNGIMGKEFSTQNCIDLMREKYGIDVEVREI